MILRATETLSWIALRAGGTRTPEAGSTVWGMLGFRVKGLEFVVQGKVQG